MEFFHQSKIYSDGKNSSAITVKSEHARVLKPFNVIQARACSVFTWKNNLRQCRNKVL